MAANFTILTGVNKKAFEIYRQKLDGQSRKASVKNSFYINSFFYQARTTALLGPEWDPLQVSAITPTQVIVFVMLCKSNQ